MEPIHLANVLFLLSYAARDVLWLRSLTFLGLGALVGVQLSSTAGGLVQIYWNAAFMLINGGHIALLIWQRRPLRMTAEEAGLRSLVFSALTDRQFADLMSVATWTEVGAGGSILSEGDRSGKILVLTEGRAVVAKGGTPMADVGPGEFIGEISFLTGEAATAAVVALERTRCAWWRGYKLRELLAADANLAAVIKGILGVDVALKLRSAGQRPKSTPAPLVEDRFPQDKFINWSFV